MEVLRNIRLIVAAVAAPIAAMAQSGVGDTPSPLRVLAGVRDYPEPVVEALVTLANQPRWAMAASESVRATGEIRVDDPDISQSARTALEALRLLPDAVLLAVERPSELAALRDLRVRDWRRAAELTQQLRDAYRGARNAAAAEWRRRLEGAALHSAYGELLNLYCEQQRARNPNFACIEVLDPAYYEVLIPDATVVNFAEGVELPSGLRELLASWDREFGNAAIDGRILSGSLRGSFGHAVSPARPRDSEGGVPQWRVSTGTASRRLAPVILQPAVDQPAEARLALALLEHERLWLTDDPSPPTAPAVLAPPHRAEQDGPRAESRSPTGYEDPARPEPSSGAAAQEANASAPPASPVIVDERYITYPDQPSPPAVIPRDTRSRGLGRYYTHTPPARVLRYGWQPPAVRVFVRPPIGFVPQCDGWIAWPVDDPEWEFRVNRVWESWED